MDIINFSSENKHEQLKKVSQEYCENYEMSWFRQCVIS